MQHCPTTLPPVTGTALPTSGPLIPCVSGSTQPGLSALDGLIPPQANAIRGVEGSLVSIIAQPICSTQFLFVYLSSTMTFFPPPFMPLHCLTCDEVAAEEVENREENSVGDEASCSLPKVYLYTLWSTCVHKPLRGD